MSDKNRSLMRGLLKLAALQIATAAVTALVATTLVSPNAKAITAAVVSVTLAMLIGFMPLRLFLRKGPEQIVAGWIAAMIVRMFAALIGLALLIKRYGFDPAAIVWTTCGMYLLLLAVETIGMTRLMRREFERRLKDER